jgi:hypothetical protein
MHDRRMNDNGSPEGEEQAEEGVKVIDVLLEAGLSNRMLGVGSDPGEPPEDVGTPPTLYRVDWHSLLDHQVHYFFEYEETDFDSFDEVKDFVLEGLRRVLAELTYLTTQLRQAESFDQLDLGWWEPLIEEIDRQGESQ